jgi:ribonuclease HIII
VIGIGFPIIGTDESGKGDYFGPLVSAGVYVDEHSAKLLELEGVRDSKKLSDKKNEELADSIIKICNDRYSIIEIPPEKYNDLYDQFIREKKNLNTLLAWGHAKAIEELLSKVECDNAIADQFADERFILSKLQEKGKKLNLIQMHKAEENIAVAAASILARARFLQKLSKLSSEYRVELPKGASINVINIAKSVVATHGRDALRKVAKLHFKTTKEVLTEQ